MNCVPISIIIQIINFCENIEKFRFCSINKEYTKLANNDLIWKQIMKELNETTILDAKSYLRKWFNKNFVPKPRKILLKHVWNGTGYTNFFHDDNIHIMKNQKDIIIVNNI